MKPHEIINVCGTPNILKLADSKARKVVLNQNELKNALAFSSSKNKKHSDYHPIPKQELYKLSEAIRAPIVMLKGNQINTDSVVLITEMKNYDGENVFVPIALDRQKGKISNISSIYGKKNIKKYLENNSDKILAINIKK